MSDKDLMEGLLLIVKGAGDLYLHGTIESSTENVHNAFHKALCDTLEIQNEIYKKMAAKGWYPSQQVEEQKIQQLKQQYAGN